MTRVVSEGPSFIAPELDRWQQKGAALLAEAQQHLGRTAVSAAGVDVSSDVASSGSIAAELGLTHEQFEFEMELADSYFNSFSLADRVSTLILYYSYFLSFINGCHFFNDSEPSFSFKCF